jgi:hypothetical protein
VIVLLPAPPPVPVSVTPAEALPSIAETNVLAEIAVGVVVSVTSEFAVSPVEFVTGTYW